MSAETARKSAQQKMIYTVLHARSPIFWPSIIDLLKLVGVLLFSQAKTIISSFKQFTQSRNLYQMMYKRTVNDVTQWRLARLFVLDRLNS